MKWSEVLVKKMITYMNQVAQAAGELTRGKWGYIIDQLTKLMKEWGVKNSDETLKKC